MCNLPRRLGGLFLLSVLFLLTACGSEEGASNQLDGGKDQDCNDDLNKSVSLYPQSAVITCGSEKFNGAICRSTPLQRYA